MRLAPIALLLCGSAGLAQVPVANPINSSQLPASPLQRLGTRQISTVSTNGSFCRGMSNTFR
jgi:hypothetical protein